jgi:hypothetical protein
MLEIGSNSAQGFGNHLLFKSVQLVASNFRLKRRQSCHPNSQSSNPANAGLADMAGRQIYLTIEISSMLCRL